MQKYSYTGLSEADAKSECRNTFIATYIRDSGGNKIIINTLAGERVIFQEEDFSHAFAYSDPVTNSEQFSFQRARRVLWIKTVVTGQQQSTRKDIGKDVYFYYNSIHKYLIYLKKLSRGDLRFITHYVAKSRKKQEWIRNTILI